MTSARNEILARIRTTSRAAPPPAMRTYRRVSTLSADERVTQFCDRVADYRAEVTRVPAANLTAEISAALAKHSARGAGIPPGLPRSWWPPDVELIPDRDLTASELDELDGVLTGCTAAIAETGTIVLAGGPTEGRRALTLVPDLHLCVVHESQIVGLVSEAVEVLDQLVKAERRPLTLISGPSATSDIELSRVEGVHGPRTFVVLVVSAESP